MEEKERERESEAKGGNDRGGAEKGKRRIKLQPKK